MSERLHSDIYVEAALWKYVAKNEFEFERDQNDEDAKKAHEELVEEIYEFFEVGTTGLSFPVFRTTCIIISEMDKKGY